MPKTRRSWVGRVSKNVAVVAEGKCWWSWKVEERSYDEGELVLTVSPKCPLTPCYSREVHQHLAERR